MLRKQIIGLSPAHTAPVPGQFDVAAVATVLVTSEDPDHPVDYAFDDRRGPGGSRWVAGGPGEQTVILAFDAPQAIRRVVLEVEEQEVARTQEVQLATSVDGGRTYREVLRQEYNFSPPGTTFEREDWAVPAGGVTVIGHRPPGEVDEGARQVSDLVVGRAHCSSPSRSPGLSRGFSVRHRDRDRFLHSRRAWSFSPHP